jgi:CheY-like chemotaxis protein
MHPLFAGNAQSIDLDMPSQATPIRADRTRILQAITNLLSNASKYTPHGGHVRVALTHDARFAILQVTDDGVGIDARLMPLVFEPFIQGERGLDREGGGLGIGLTLVRRLVEAHGGTVAAASGGTDRGSTFSIRLPMCDEVPTAVATEQASTAGTRRLRVLVVDDNRDIADSTAMLLRMIGHDVDVAYDGRTAIDRARGLRPDVVLLDIGLPGVNGYQVARLLRSEPSTRHVRLVACTGYGREGDRDLAHASGFDHHAVKPVAAQTLLAILAEASGAGAAAEPRP